MSTIYFFLKFCENEVYARDFIEGRLRLNPLLKFKETEYGFDGRGDSDEGVEAWFQPGKIRLTVAGHLIESADMVEPVKMSRYRFESVNLLCLYAGTSGSLQETSIEDLRAQLLIPDICYTMGSVAVLVRNVTEFQRRVRASVKASGFGQKDGLVDYFDPSQFHGRVRHPVFAKRSEYSWQREYRFAVDRHLDVPEPYMLNLGSLRDICEIVDPRTLNASMQILRPES